MDTKNVLFAVILSTVVLVFWSTFFEPPPIETNVTNKQETINEEVSSPSIEEKETNNEIKRSDAIAKTKRIKVENHGADKVEIKEEDL